MEQPSPAYVGDEAFVFFSYSHDDKALVFEESRWLQDLGIKVWYNARIGAGRDGLKRSRTRLCVAARLSTSSHRGRWHRRTAARAESRGGGASVSGCGPSGTDDPVRRHALSLNNRQAILKHQLGSSQYEKAMLRFLAGTPVSGEGVPVHPADQ